MDQRCVNCRFWEQDCEDPESKCYECKQTACGGMTHWMPATTAQTLERAMPNMKLKGDITSGYSYVDTDAVNAELYGKWVTPSFPKIEKFCFENDIKWRIDVDSRIDAYKLFFTYRFMQTSILIEKSSIRKMHSTLGLENSIIQDLHKKFDLKERETMAEKLERIQYNSYYGIRANSGRYPWKETKPEIKDVIFNDPATIVLWSDGDKTIVKCDGEDFDPEKGLAMAIVKKFMGTNKSKSNYCDIFKKYCPEKVEFGSEPEPVEKKTIRLMSTMEYAKFAGVGESTVRKQLADGKIPGAYKRDRKWVIPVEV